MTSSPWTTPSRVNLPGLYTWFTSSWLRSGSELLVNILTLVLCNSKWIGCNYHVPPSQLRTVTTEGPLHCNPCPPFSLSPCPPVPLSPFLPFFLSPCRPYPIIPLSPLSPYSPVPLPGVPRFRMFLVKNAADPERSKDIAMSFARM